MSSKIAYIYDQTTHELTHAWTVQESPLEPGVWLTPASSTYIAPPATQTNQAAVFDTVANAWTVVPDYRGQTMYSQTSTATQQVTALGAPPAGWAITPPPATLDSAKTAQIQAMNLACQAAIFGGFQTSINGSLYTVTLSTVDQSNALMAATTVQGVMAKSKPWTANTAVNVFDVCLVNGQYYLCVTAGTTGATVPTMPTAFSVAVPDGTAQWKLFGVLIGVSTGNVWCDAATTYLLFEQGVNYIHDCRARYTALKQKILGCSTIPSVQAIVW